jgi:hypothetical protein
MLSRMLIHVDKRFTSQLKTIQKLYDEENPCGVDLSSEDAVQCFLDHTWLRRAGRILGKFVQVEGIGKAFTFAGMDTVQLPQDQKASIFSS